MKRVISLQNDELIVVWPDGEVYNQDFPGIDEDGGLMKIQAIGVHLFSHSFRNIFDQKVQALLSKDPKEMLAFKRTFEADLSTMCKELLKGWSKITGIAGGQDFEPLFEFCLQKGNEMAEALATYKDIAVGKDNQTQPGFASATYYHTLVTFLIPLLKTMSVAYFQDRSMDKSMLGVSEVRGRKPRYKWV